MQPHYPSTASLVRALSSRDTYARATRVHYTRLHKRQMKRLSMHSPTVKKGQNYQILGLPSLDMSNFSCKTKIMSSPNNLTATAQTTLVHPWGLDNPMTLLFVKATTFDTKQSPLTSDKIYMASYVALQYTRQPSMSVLAQEHRHNALSSQAPKLTGYL